MSENEEELKFPNEEPEEEDGRLPAPEEWITNAPVAKPSSTPAPFAMPTDDDWLTELKSTG